MVDRQADREDDDEASDEPPDDAPRATELTWCVRHPVTQKLLLACYAKRTYTIGPKRLTLADEQVPLTVEPEIEVGADEGYRTLLDETDLLAPKVATDVVVRGHAHSAVPVEELFVAVAVGGFARRLRVRGVRRAEVRGDGSVRFSGAAPFTEVALVYDHAYGGYDRHAHDALDPAPAGLPGWDYGSSQPVEGGEPRPVGIFAYPRNAIGAGFFLDLDRPRADGALLPQIEDPTDDLTPARFFVPTPLAWIDAPIPGSLGWLHHAWYPRFARFMGPRLPHHPPARPIRETLLGEDDLADMASLEAGTIHPRALQGAAPGLARSLLAGDEPVVLHNLHRDRADVRFDLPGEVPRFALRPPGLEALMPRPSLQSVRIEPDLGRVALTWLGVVPLLGPIDHGFLRRTHLAVTWGSSR